MGDAEDDMPPARLTDIARFTYTPLPDARFKRQTITAHLPQIDLAQVDATHMPFGMLASWSFSEWLDLFEGLAAHDWGGEYGAAQGFVGLAREGQWSSDEVKVDELAALGRRLGDYAWLTIAASYGRFTVHPRCSSGYVLLRQTDGQLRTARFRGFGDLDCIAMPVRITIEPGHVAGLSANARTIFSLAEKGVGDTLHHIVAPFASAASLTVLETRWPRFVANLEAFFNPTGLRPLKQTFQTRFAGSLARDAGDYDHLARLSAALFDYRSELFHGQAAGPSLQLIELLGPENFPFPADLVRRLIALLAAFDASSPLGAEPDRLDWFSPGGPLYEQTAQAQLSIIRLGLEATVLTSGYREQLVLSMPRAAMDDVLEAAAEHEAAVTEPGRAADPNVEGIPVTADHLPTTEALAGVPADALMASPAVSSRVQQRILGVGTNDFDGSRIMAGPHFRVIAGEDVVVFVPLAGLVLPQALTPLQSNREVYEMPHGTWMSLNTAPVRDMYGASAVFSGHAVLQIRYRLGTDFAAGEADALVAALVDPSSAARRALDDEVLAFQLGLTVAEGGDLIDPFEIAWKIVRANRRISLTERFSFFSWCAPQKFDIRYRQTFVENLVELDELPLTFFESNGLSTAADGLRQADDFTSALLHRRRFEIPEYRSVAQSYCRSRSITLSSGAQLSHFIFAFERCFGPLSSDRIELTHRRLSNVLGRIRDWTPPTLEDFAGSFRRMRNAVAHGRLPEEADYKIFPVADLALRTFLSEAVAIGLPEDFGFLPRGAAFQMLKNRIFDEVSR